MSDQNRTFMSKMKNQALVFKMKKSDPSVEDQKEDIGVQNRSSYTSVQI